MSPAPMILYHRSAVVSRKYLSIPIFFITHSTRLRKELEPIATFISLCWQYSRNGMSVESDSRPSSKSVIWVCHIFVRSVSTSRCISYFQASISQTCKRDFVAYPSLSKSVSSTLSSLSRKNRHKACFMMGVVWAMTLSKSNNTAWKGFILFECLDYTPFCSWFVPGKSCEKSQKWYLEIEAASE